MLLYLSPNIAVLTVGANVIRDGKEDRKIKAEESKTGDIRQVIELSCPKWVFNVN